MKVSVVIPAYNEGKYIADCLKSLDEQEEKADEIIVVDNNSTDNTAAIAEKCGARVIIEKKQGTLAARDTGFNAAKFEILARTDADTRVSPQWIKTAKQILADPTIVGASGPLLYNIYFSRYTKSINDFFYFMINKPFLKNGNFIGPNMIIRRDIWKKIRENICLNEHDIHEDMDISIHAAQYGKIAYDSRLMVSTSGRRLKDLKTIFIKYPSKSIHTLLQRHKKEE